MRHDLQTRRKALSGRLVVLQSQLRAMDAPLPTLTDTDPPPLRPAGKERASEAELASIHSALARMDRGEYGICMDCGETISKDRLDVLPFTSHCRACARKMA